MLSHSQGDIGPAVTQTLTRLPPDTRPSDFLPLTQPSQVHRSAELTSLERRLHTSVPSLDSHPTLESTSLSMVLPRYSNIGFSDHHSRHMLPSSPTLTSYPVTNANMTLLDQGRALSTLSLPVTPSGYPLLSPTLLSSSPTASSLQTASYLGSSPTAMLSSSFLYPPYQPNITYIRSPTDASNRSLELLSGQESLGVRPLPALSPSPPHTISSAMPSSDLERVKEEKHHELAPARLPQQDPTEPDPSDPTAVWRPY